MPASKSTGWAFSTRLAPPMHELQRAQLTLRWRLRPIRQRPARERWAKYTEVALRVLRSGTPRPQTDFDFRGAAEIACRYQQPGHEVPMHLFVSEDSAADAKADLLGWDEFHKGPLAGHRLAGDHFSLLRAARSGAARADDARVAL